MSNVNRHTDVTYQRLLIYIVLSMFVQKYSMVHYKKKHNERLYK